MRPWWMFNTRKNCLLSCRTGTCGCLCCHTTAPLLCCLALRALIWACFGGSDPDLLQREIGILRHSTGISHTVLNQGIPVSRQRPAWLCDVTSGTGSSARQGDHTPSQVLAPPPSKATSLRTFSKTHDNFQYFFFKADCKQRVKCVCVGFLDCRGSKRWKTQLQAASLG